MESIYLNICNGKTVIIDIRALQRECNNVDTTFINPVWKRLRLPPAWYTGP